MNQQERTYSEYKKEELVTAICNKDDKIESLQQELEEKEEAIKTLQEYKEDLQIRYNEVEKALKEASFKPASQIDGGATVNYKVDEDTQKMIADLRNMLTSFACEIKIDGKPKKIMIDPINQEVRQMDLE